MLRAVLFDMGGTLDGNGLHWLDRFVAEYVRAGVSLPREVIRAAFDAAERRMNTDTAIMSASLEEMVARHIAWQVEHIGPDAFAGAPAFEASVTRSFVEGVRNVATPHVTLLHTLHQRGLRLGVVSNACGNVDRLCDDFGFSPYLSFVIDSRRVGVSKPDPAIYELAVQRLGLPPASILMVGDSFDRDIRPARALGLRTAWLAPVSQPCPDPSLVDVSLSALSDLAAVLEMPARTVA